MFVATGTGPTTAKAAAGRHARAPRQKTSGVLTNMKSTHIYELSKRACDAAHVHGTELSDRLPGYVDGNTLVHAHVCICERQITRELRFLVNAMFPAHPIPFSSLVTYIRINRRKDGRGRCIPAFSNDRGNENTSADHGKIWCRSITWEIPARDLLRPCITVVWPPIISCLFYDPSPNNRKDFAPLGRLIGRRVHYCIDISCHAGTTPIGKIPRRIRRGKWFTVLVTFWMVTRRCVGTIALRYVEHSW